jgi:ATP-binding cassette subfamily F protein 3
MITVSALTKSFGPRDLFRDVDLQIGARDRIALVGPNGAGKTTLVEMLAGEQEPDAGDIRIARDVVIGYLRQETDALRGRTLLEEVLSAGEETNKVAHRLEILEHEMAEMEPGPDRDALMVEYGRLQDRFSTLGGYTLEAEAKTILAGLGFSEEDLERPTDALSGGWLMRVALAKLLLSSPDLLMLDEPTNHLDVESVDWLERFLSGYEGAVLLISHDRDFINGVVTKVVEIDRAQLIPYTGNYEAFVRQREAIAIQAEATAKNQAKQREATEQFIERFRYKATKAKQVQSRIKSLERMEKAEPARKKQRKMNLAFPVPPRASRVVVELEHVRFGYGEKVVYDDLNLVVERDHKIALVGPNGAGKTTLLKLLAGALEPQGGVRRMGHHADLGYFAQHQIEALDQANTVLEELAKAIPRGVTLRPRDLLGRFLFSGDDVAKKVAVLSGGERTRLALAKLLVSPLNILCLDEPTNHLDIPSRDVLEDALTDYQGALVLITHDRHLIRSVADRIVEVVNGRVTEFDGDYDYYLARRQEADAPAEKPKPSGPKPKERRRLEAMERARTKELRDRISSIETRLDQVTAEMDRISKQLADPDAYSSGVDLSALVKEYEGWKKKSKRLERDWDEATRALEEMTRVEAASS